MTLTEALREAHDLGYLVKKIKLGDVELELVPKPVPMSPEQIKAAEESNRIAEAKMRYSHTGLVPNARRPMV